MLIAVLEQLDSKCYAITYNGSSSIGAHMRHIIEYLDILVNASETDIINYANRKRDLRLETEMAFAIEKITQLKSKLVQEDRNVQVEEEEEIFNSSYLRELLYQHEHIVHHGAILKMKLDDIPNVEIDPCFGMARSTLQHNAKNVSS
jgi:methionine aminopeptidase